MYRFLCILYSGIAYAIFLANTMLIEYTRMYTIFVTRRLPDSWVNTAR